MSTSVNHPSNNYSFYTKFTQENNLSPSSSTTSCPGGTVAPPNIHHGSRGSVRSQPNAIEIVRSLEKVLLPFGFHPRCPPPYPGLLHVSLAGNPIGAWSLHTQEVPRRPLKVQVPSGVDPTSYLRAHTGSRVLTSLFQSNFKSSSHYSVSLFLLEISPPWSFLFLGSPSDSLVIASVWFHSYWHELYVTFHKKLLSTEPPSTLNRKNRVPDSSRFVDSNPEPITVWFLSSDLIRLKGNCS